MSVRSIFFVILFPRILLFPLIKVGWWVPPNSHIKLHPSLQISQYLLSRSAWFCLDRHIHIWLDHLADLTLWTMYNDFISVYTLSECLGLYIYLVERERRSKTGRHTATGLVPRHAQWLDQTRALAGSQEGDPGLPDGQQERRLSCRHCQPSCTWEGAAAGARQNSFCVLWPEHKCLKYNKCALHVVSDVGTATHAYCWCLLA